MGQSQTKEDYIQPHQNISKTSTNNIQRPSHEIHQPYQLVQNPYIQQQVKKEIIPSIRYKGGKINSLKQSYINPI
jgi:hypothetical protein